MNKTLGFFVSPTGEKLKVVGRLELIPAILRAEFWELTKHIKDKLEPHRNFEEKTEVLWDQQYPERCDGKRQYLLEDGTYMTEDKIAWEEVLA